MYNLHMYFSYDEELAQTDILAQDIRNRLGATGTTGLRGARDSKRPSPTTWK